MSSYDVLYQDWLKAKKSKDYAAADTIRDTFEKDHGLTIIREGTMPVEGVTVQRMLHSKWEKKYGNKSVGELMEEYDSKVKYLFPGYRGTLYVR